MKTEISNEHVEFKNIDPGLYDNTMQCPYCEFKYEDRADNSSSENTQNSKHLCFGANDNATREPMSHDLKTDPAVFQPLIEEDKTYELRKNDRDFRVGDTLNLLETTHSGADIAQGAPLEYTGRTCKRIISHILRGPIYGLADGWVILSCRIVS